jgi:hypothetical protein
MENFSFELSWGDAPRLIFSSAILVLGALIGIPLNDAARAQW